MKEWIVPYVKEQIRRKVFVVFFGMLGVLSGAALLFVSGYLISKSALRPENVMMIYVPIVSVRAFSISQAVFPYLQQLLGHDVVLRILAKYRTKVYALLEEQARLIKERFQTGELLQVLSDDIEELQHFYLRTLYPSVIGVFIYALIAIIFGFFDLIFMFFMLAVLGIIVFLIPAISYYILRKSYRDIKQSKGTLYQTMTDALFGRQDWLASGRVQEVIENASSESDTLLKKQHQIHQWHYVRDALLQVVIGISILLTIIWTNIQVKEDVLSPTLIAAFVLMMFSITDALFPLSDAVEEVPAHVDAIERLSSIKYHSEAKKQTITKKLDDEIAISVDDVSFQYHPSSPYVLRNVSLSIKKGEKIAILGKSGTGKSTLLKLFAGILRPTEGNIQIGESPADRALLGNELSVLNQKPHLFDTTIANNVRIGKRNATDEEVIDVLERVQMMELIRSLPDGIDTQMEEMGNRFSGGERQRIAFARVLIQNTPIILLDEATTGLDEQTEMALLQTILQAAENKTIVWITHHLIGAPFMDKVLFLDDGNIKLHGSHDELYRESDYYRTLYEMDRGF